MTTYKKFFRYASIPALIAIGYLGFVLVWRSLGLPDTKEIIALAENYYEQYGYYTVLVGALIEGALFVNWYLPGSVVVALGVVLSRSAGLNVFLVLFLIILGFYLTALLNYLLWLCRPLSSGILFGQGCFTFSATPCLTISRFSLWWPAL